MTRAHDPAFPPQAGEYLPAGAARGLTVREYVASQALAGLLAYPGTRDDYDPEGAAQDAVQYADALLAALAKGA